MSTDTKTESVVKARADDAASYWLKEGWAPGGHIREVDFATEARGLDPMFAGIKIVDCDTHFTEPADLWTANAPAHLKDKMPHVRRIDGADQWFVGDRHFGSMGGNVIGKDRNKLLGRLAFPNYDQIDPGSFDVGARLDAMDAMGVWAQICFQNGGVTQAGSLVALNDDELAITITQIFNDACKDRMDASDGRINCMGTLPYWGKDVMNAEMRRIADLGLKGITLPDRPERLSEGYVGPDGGVSPFWEEVFETCEATGIPLNFHLNASLDANTAIWDNLGFDQKLPIHALIHHIGCAATMSNFMVSGILDKYPNLKIGLIESGAGWVPFWLEGMEHQLDEFRTAQNRGLKKRPKEYFKQNFWVSFWFEDYAPRNMLDEIGVDKVMFETDYPHPTSLYPGVQNKLVAVLAEHDQETRRRVLELNARELYNLEF
ncbi:amidohydrolase family protein [Novosphingobium malaysiense]|uniref:Amidohydrolase n=1 Tax=Novosphingobium malaysiense TaxID=1348853 RepID=A0A0B1ZNR9_9SPHN|nr:amidohydrolase family protein [Novosphingobium malaysiense]KHK90914.1 amidohydrolase [Novosphingobium malaysiense]